MIEHCYDPRQFAHVVFETLEPGGLVFISTPYHGYWKNLVLAVTGRWDDHLTVLWDGGHIKFFSIKTFRLCSKRQVSDRSSCCALAGFHL